MSRSNLSGKSESTSSQDHTIKEAVSVEVLKNSSLKVEESENGETSQPMLPDTLSGSSINHHPAVTDKKDVLPPSAEHLIEPTVSDLEREILLRGDSAEKRSKILQLPSTSLRNTPSHCEREAVGDDRAQNRVHVLCECEQPTVAGAAVPIVTSFTAPNSNVMATTKKEVTHKPRPSLIPKLTTTFKSGKPGSDPARQGRNICFSDSSNKVKRDSQEQDEEVQKVKRYRQLTKEFTKYVSRLAEETTNLTKEVNSPETQSSAVDELYRHIINLRKVTTELKTLQSTRAVSEPQISKVQEYASPPTDTIDSTIKSKNKDKIYIKFLPTKSTVKHKKSCNSEVQTNVEDNLLKSSLEPKEVDSMDGVFIPSADGPPISEDDDDVDDEGLDITITFPELQKTFDQNDSHLSVCFSDLSAEALGRLKRCPKEFTLRMDFVQGKMFFQSARSNANNYSIGPDMKIIECNMDSKKSDLISIKPSTECLYTSQIIPVEGASTKESIKILKSTDSELFNVVSLPHMNRKCYSATQSCFTFRNIRNKVFEESMLADRFYYKSMPQIPSLTRILEEPSKELLYPVRHEKRTRIRGLQRKRTATSLEHIL